MIAPKPQILKSAMNILNHSNSTGLLEYVPVSDIPPYISHTRNSSLDRPPPAQKKGQYNTVEYEQYDLQYENQAVESMHNIYALQLVKIIKMSI